MTELVEDCLRGTLTADRLQAYQDIGNVDVNAPGSSRKVTPLAAACWKGHIKVVRLLLDNAGALPDAPSARGRTPLHFATSQSPRKNRAAIVQLLLDAGANADAASDEDGLTTPLMNAITQVKDEEVVRVLVDGGGSLDKPNAQKKSARDLAKAQGGRFTRALEGSKGLTSSIAAAIDVFLAVIMFVIAWTNNTAVTEYVVQAANKINERLGPKVDQPSAPGQIDNGVKAADASKLTNGLKPTNPVVTPPLPAPFPPPMTTPSSSVTQSSPVIQQASIPRPTPPVSQPPVVPQLATGTPRPVTPQRTSTTPQPPPISAQKPGYQGTGNVQDRYGFSGTANTVTTPIEENVKVS